MFVQIHMLQSMPPGNLNRDDMGQPKKCIFGGVSRGRISSQCLKRNIRHSVQFREMFGDKLSVRTTYMPRMVADELKELRHDLSEEELNKIRIALAKKFKAEKKATGDSGDSEDGEAMNESSDPGNSTEQTGQLVFFSSEFAHRLAELIVELRDKENQAYTSWLSGKVKKEDDKRIISKHLAQFENAVIEASKSLTVDIGLFGRMTTSDLIINVEASCQVAHAISTHEVFVESDFFTAIDEKKAEYATTQTAKIGAGFLGSGDTETFFNSAVYYKYLNLDLNALQKHLSLDNESVANIAGVLVHAAALANPSGKQNSFAAHGVPELILVEVTKSKHPISYANAFLEPVEGRNLMNESAVALKSYVNSVACAFMPKDVRRALLAIGSASVDLSVHVDKRVSTLDELVKSVIELVRSVPNE